MQTHSVSKVLCSAQCWLKQALNTSHPGHPIPHFFQNGCQAPGRVLLLLRPRSHAAAEEASFSVVFWHQASIEMKEMAWHQASIEMKEIVLTVTLAIPSHPPFLSKWPPGARQSAFVARELLFLCRHTESAKYCAVHSVG